VKLYIKNARIILKDSVINGGVLISDGRIMRIEKNRQGAPEVSMPVLDAGGMYLSPGFFDLHTHGAGGSDFMDESPDDMVEAAKTHLRYGTTSLLPTTVAASPEEMLRCIDNFHTVQKSMRDGPNLIGLHMEGPYFSVKQKGAIDERYIRIPDPSEYRKMVEHADGAIARWSVAPELDGAMEMGDYLTQNHILPSIGHTDAEYSHVREATLHGYTHVTHLYSGMSTIVRRGGFRYLGVTESAYAIEELTVEIIADGCHLPPELLGMVYRLKGPDKICIVSDSMRCAGTDSRESELGNRNSGRSVIIEDGVAKLPDRSAFAGSIATDDRLVRVMHEQVGVPLHDCIRMMCLTPATIMHMDAEKGSIEPGKDADLVLFDDQIHVNCVLVAGKVVYRQE
jgi:N-acetylglucosamine-6-phosphate deacetylase